MYKHILIATDGSEAEKILSTVSATAKMAMAVEGGTGEMFDPDALRGRLPCLLLR